eukprot:TRINITY_DN8323_c0_g6_i1.p1 TRINITY_DN8323_c0_g6~~TRINITY_DN8323_c0_g6_i1.p1  ORF type:complete len:621 (-),score=119.11 TRINITY_DN8323_c0_g6_i1:77-1912(-)
MVGMQRDPQVELPARAQRLGRTVDLVGGDPGAPGGASPCQQASLPAVPGRGVRERKTLLEQEEEGAPEAEQDEPGGGSNAAAAAGVGGGFVQLWRLAGICFGVVVGIIFCSGLLYGISNGQRGVLQLQKLGDSSDAEMSVSAGGRIRAGAQLSAVLGHQQSGAPDQHPMHSAPQAHAQAVSGATQSAGSNELMLRGAAGRASPTLGQAPAAPASPSPWSTAAPSLWSTAAPSALSVASTTAAAGSAAPAVPAPAQVSTGRRRHSKSTTTSRRRRRKTALASLPSTPAAVEAASAGLAPLANATGPAAAVPPIAGSGDVSLLRPGPLGADAGQLEKATLVLLHLVSDRDADHTGCTQAPAGRAKAQRSKNMRGFRRGLPLLRRLFLQKFPYPITIFYSPFRGWDEDFAEIRGLLGPQSTVEAVALPVFGRDNFYAPAKSSYNRYSDPCSDPTGCSGFPFSYRQMNYIFMYAMFFDTPVLAKYDFWLRVDADAYLKETPRKDPFKVMRAKGWVFSYRWKLESPDCNVNFPKEVKNYAKTHGITPADKNFFDEYADKWIEFYGNLGAGYVPFYRSVHFKQLMEYLLDLGGIVVHRSRCRRPHRVDHRPRSLSEG